MIFITNASRHIHHLTTVLHWTELVETYHRSISQLRRSLEWALCFENVGSHGHRKWYHCSRFFSLPKYCRWHRNRRCLLVLSVRFVCWRSSSAKNTVSIAEVSVSNMFSIVAQNAVAPKISTLIRIATRIFYWHNGKTFSIGCSSPDSSKSCWIVKYVFRFNLFTTIILLIQSCSSIHEMKKPKIDFMFLTCPWVARNMPHFLYLVYFSLRHTCVLFLLCSPVEWCFKPCRIYESFSDSYTKGVVVSLLRCFIRDCLSISLFMLRWYGVE